MRVRLKSLEELRGPLPGALLAAAFTVVTLLSLRPLIGVDRLLNFAFERAWPQFDPLMSVLAKFGQRGLLLPLLFGLAIFLARRRRLWEPIVITLVSVLTVNFMVGVLKLATARDKPVTGDPLFFQQGVLYPSGHAANAIMYFGLAVFLVRRYGKADGPLARGLLVLTWVACCASMITLLYLQLHWFTDIVGGLLLGGAVLRSTVYDRGLIRRLSMFAEHLRQLFFAAWKRRRERGRTAETAQTARPPAVVNGTPSPLPPATHVPRQEPERDDAGDARGAHVNGTSGSGGVNGAGGLNGVNGAARDVPVVPGVVREPQPGD